MQIKVDRTECSVDKLVFTITCSDRDIIDYSAKELGALTTIDEATRAMQEFLGKNSEVFGLLVDGHHEIKERIFDELLEKMKRAIRQKLENKFTPIVQEVYNWVFDHQDDDIKKWMTEFNPERTVYYFDNDPRMTSQNEAKQPDDKFDDEEDEDDDEE